METFIIQSDDKKAKAIKMFLKAIDVDFKVKKTKLNDAFTKKIEESKKQVEQGDYITIKNAKNIWEDILSE